MESPSQIAPPPGPPLGMPIRAWLLLFALYGVMATLLYDALWEPAVIAAYFGAGVAIQIAVHFRRGSDESRRPSWPFTLIHGLFLGWVLLLSSAFAWFAAEVLARGKAPEPVLWPIRLLMAFLIGVFWLALLQRRRRWDVIRQVGLGAVNLGIIATLIYVMVIAGPDDVSKYPPPSQSPYRLPWKPGNAHLCCQGNGSVLSHVGWQTYAYDFIMPVGTEVCAAREGQVVSVVDEHDGNGLNAKGNFVHILHEDGTYAGYLHIRQGGSRVTVGQWVEQGEVIAESGNVGYSTNPHLHFHVVHDRTTIPVSFADVPGDGIPRTFRRYSRATRKGPC